MIESDFKYFLGLRNDGRIEIYVGQLTDQEKAEIALLLDGQISMFTKNLNDIIEDYKLWVDFLRERRPELFQEVKQ